MRLDLAELAVTQGELVPVQDVIGMLGQQPFQDLPLPIQGPEPLGDLPGTRPFIADLAGGDRDREEVVGVVGVLGGQRFVQLQGAPQGA